MMHFYAISSDDNVNLYYLGLFLNCCKNKSRFDEELIMRNPSNQTKSYQNSSLCSAVLVLGKRMDNLPRIHDLGPGKTKPLIRKVTTLEKRAIHGTWYT